MAPIVSEKHREERKTIILNAAEEVFIKKGYNGATIQDVIEASNISRGGVYTYYQNIEDIFVELQHRRDKKDTWDPESLYSGGKTSWQVLSSILESVKEKVENQTDKLVPVIYEYYTTAGWKSKRHIPSLEFRIESAVKNIAYIIEKGIKEKEFNPDISGEDVARTILSFLDGAFLNSYQLGAEKTKLSNQFEMFKTFIKTCLVNIQTT